MQRKSPARLSLALACVSMIGLMCALPASADAVSDLTIATKGNCATGAALYVITNNNTTNAITTTVVETTVSYGQTSTAQKNISLAPGEGKSLGCAPQDPSINVKITWKVQTAQYN